MASDRRKKTKQVSIVDQKGRATDSIGVTMLDVTQSIKRVTTSNHAI